MPACLHAKVRGRCVSAGRLRGAGCGGLEKGARCTRGRVDATWTVQRAVLELSPRDLWDTSGDQASRSIS